MKQGCALQGQVSADAAEALRRLHHRWKVGDHREKQGSSVPPRTLGGEWRLGRGGGHQQGLQTADGRLPATDAAGRCSRPEMPSRQPGSEIRPQPKPMHVQSQSCPPAPESGGALRWSLHMCRRQDPVGEQAEARVAQPILGCEDEEDLENSSESLPYPLGFHSPVRMI